MYNLLFSILTLSDGIVASLENFMGIGYSILYNTIGVTAMVLQILMFQMRNKRNIVIVGMICNLGWLTYFVLQGDFISGTSGIIGIMSKVIILLQSKYDWAKSKWWNVLFLTFAGVFSLLTFKSLLDIFALFACMSLILAFFMTKENTIRKVALISYCASICNTLSKFFVVALVADITALISVIISLIRYRKADNEELVENS